MKTLHAEDFIEFTVLPYIIGVLATLNLLAGLINRKKIFLGIVILFIVTSVVTMADFWRWEYNYGHDLNPEAAIKVPGMAYQPPLIGYKQLLNFSAYSIPASGGLILYRGRRAAHHICALCVYRFKTKNQTSLKKDKGSTLPAVSLFVVCFVFLFSCTTKTQPLRLGKDNCDYCRMTISDARFGAEIITAKGKAYKFDDMHCILSFLKAGSVDTVNARVYLVDFYHASAATCTTMSILKSDALRSPMQGNMAAFASKENLAHHRSNLKARPSHGMSRCICNEKFLVTYYLLFAFHAQVGTADRTVFAHK